MQVGEIVTFNSGYSINVQEKSGLQLKLAESKQTLSGINIHNFEGEGKWIDLTEKGIVRDVFRNAKNILRNND